MKKAVYSFLFIYFSARLALFFSGFYMSPDDGFYGGASADISAASAARALEYYRWGYEFRILSFINAAVYLFICAKAFFTIPTAEFALRNGYAELASGAARFYTGLALAVLPYRFVLGYLREKHFGFFNQGPGGWSALYLKQFVLSLLLLIAVLAAAKFIVAFFRDKWHYAAALCVPAAGLAFTLLLQFAVLPVFYRTIPLADAALKERLLSLANANFVHAREISVIDESSYSSHTNAFFTGFGPFRRIYLCDTLLSVHDHDEIEAIYAHELGHYIYDHELYGILLASLASAAAFFLAASFFGRLGITHEALAANFNRYSILALILSQAAYFFIMPVENYISRRFERAADDFAMGSVVRQGLANGLKPRDEIVKKAVAAHKGLFINLAENNRSLASPDRFNYFFFATHPSITERLRRAGRAADAE